MFLCACVILLICLAFVMSYILEILESNWHSVFDINFFTIENLVHVILNTYLVIRYLEGVFITFNKVLTLLLCLNDTCYNIFVWGRC